MKSDEVEADIYLNARDTRGQRRVGAAERVRLLEELEGSAFTVKDFAEQKGINYYTLIGWRQAWRKQSGLERCDDSAAGDLADRDHADCGDHCTNDRGSGEFVTGERVVADDPDDHLKPAMAATGLQSTKPLHFTEVCLREASPPSTGTRATTPLEVTLRGGAVVRTADMTQLAELLQLLGN